jgi:hypothetical protein
MHRPFTWLTRRHGQRVELRTCTSAVRPFVLYLNNTDFFLWIVSIALLYVHTRTRIEGLILRLCTFWNFSIFGMLYWRIWNKYDLNFVTRVKKKGTWMRSFETPLDRLIILSLWWIWAVFVSYGWWWCCLGGRQAGPEGAGCWRWRRGGQKRTRGSRERVARQVGSLWPPQRRDRLASFF